ncbi:membrane protein [Salmonella enterica subsp. diarizonae]|uniref:Membrane protein n=1 Tax=Salmonella diarizonae TaxID=59204 RepID=A0A379TXS8_SALDZ|nr:membrane protein [Salmonella enterica subsp. diarizonae]
MTAEGHLLFLIASAVFAKNAELTPVLAQGDWWHIIPSAILTCLLPDIDHPKSFLGQRLKWVSKPIARAFGHRGFTHSCWRSLPYWRPFISRYGYVDYPGGCAARHGTRLFKPYRRGYAHAAGVPLLWPCRWRFRLPILAPRKGNQLERFYVWRCLPGRCGCRSRFRKIAPYAGLRR